MTTTFWLAALLAALMVLNGCAKMFACTTDVTYIVRPDKTVEGSYSSCKEQTGFRADIDPSTGKARIESDKSSTQESIVAASLQMQLTLMRMLEQLLAKTPIVGPLK